MQGIMMSQRSGSVASHSAPGLSFPLISSPPRNRILLSLKTALEVWLHVVGPHDNWCTTRIYLKWETNGARSLHEAHQTKFIVKYTEKKLLPNWSLTMRLVNAEKQVFAVIFTRHIISSFVRIFVIKLQHRSRETLTCNVCQPANSIWRDFCVFFRIQSWRKPEKI